MLCTDEWTAIVVWSVLRPCGRQHHIDLLGRNVIRRAVGIELTWSTTLQVFCLSCIRLKEGTGLRSHVFEVESVFVGIGQHRRHAFIARHHHEAVALGVGQHIKSLTIAHVERGREHF